MTATRLVVPPAPDVLTAATRPGRSEQRGNSRPISVTGGALRVEGTNFPPVAYSLALLSTGPVIFDMPLRAGDLRWTRDSHPRGSSQCSRSYRPGWPGWPGWPG